MLVMALPEGTANTQETLQGETTPAGQAIPWAGFLFKPATGLPCRERVYAPFKMYNFYLLIKFKLFLLSAEALYHFVILPY